MNYKKLGIVITTHGYNGIYVRQCVNCFLKFFPNAYIVLFVNESKDKITLNLKKTHPKIHYIYINNQNKNGGLTGTWNQGIDLCLKNNCEVICLSNDDLKFGNSIYHIINSAFNDKSGLKYYGPLSNNPGVGITCKRNQKSNRPKNLNNFICKNNNKPHQLNGFFMVFPKKSLLKNKFNNKFYFNPRFPFGGNENEWFRRFKSKGGKPIVVPRTFIFHYKFKSWRGKNNKNNKRIKMAKLFLMYKRFLKIKRRMGQRR